MATMANEVNSSAASESYDKLITELDLAYREGNTEEIQIIEEKLEKALDDLDAACRTEQMHNENWQYE